MPRITGMSFRQDGLEYALTLSWDEDAFLEGNIKFDIEVCIKDVESHGMEVAGAASVLLESDPHGEQYLVVRINDSERFRQPLSAIMGDTTVIDAIPREVFGLGDPIVGCLLRAGIAATCGQIIECKDKSAGHEWVTPRMKQIGGCLVGNSKQLAGRALVRAGWCIFSG